MVSSVTKSSERPSKRKIVLGLDVYIYIYWTLKDLSFLLSLADKTCRIHVEF
jgi:hypothetical protein